MIILFIIIGVIFISCLIAYWNKKPIFYHVPWLWNNIGKPLRDYIMVVSVRRITLSYFLIISGLSFSLPFRKILACISNGESVSWMSIEFDESNIDIFTCITIIVITIAYLFFIRYETAVLDNNRQSWIDRLLKKIDEITNMLNLIAQNKKECHVSFSNGSNEITINPLFKIVRYERRPEKEEGKTYVASPKNTALETVIKGCLSQEYIQSISSKYNHKVKPLDLYVCIGKELKSYSPIDITFHSIGRDPLDDVYLQIIADNEKVKIIDTNREVNTIYVDIMEFKRRLNNRHIKDNTVNVHINTINGGMDYSINTFYIKVPHDCNELNLLWRVNARSFRKEGILHIIVSPNYVAENRISNNDNSGTFIEDVEEFIRQE